MRGLLVVVWLAVAQIGGNKVTPLQACASTYGGPGDPGTKGDTGYKGDHLTGKMAFAELGMGTALGKLPYKAKITITYKGRSVTAEKLDIGAGGPPCGGHARKIDLWYQTAEALGFTGLGVVSYTVSSPKKAGFLEKALDPTNLDPFTETGEKVGGAINSATAWTKDLGNILGFIGSSQGWARILKVIGGSVLLVIAIDELSKIGPGPNTNVKGTAAKVPTAAKAAKKATEVALL